MTSSTFNLMKFFYLCAGYMQAVTARWAINGTGAVLKSVHHTQNFACEGPVKRKARTCSGPGRKRRRNRHPVTRSPQGQQADGRDEEGTTGNHQTRQKAGQHRQTQQASKPEKVPRMGHRKAGRRNRDTVPQDDDHRRRWRTHHASASWKRPAGLPGRVLVPVRPLEPVALR